MILKQFAKQPSEILKARRVVSAISETLATVLITEVTFEVGDGPE